jgi:hypothetical protein
MALVALTACARATPGRVDAARLQTAADEPGQWLALGSAGDAAAIQAFLAQGRAALRIQEQATP